MGLNFSAFTALRHRDYRRFMAGQSFSLVGSWVQSTAQGWLVTLLAPSEDIATAWLGAASLIGSLPMFFGAFHGGAVADRLPKRTIILWMQVVQALLAAGMAGLTLSHAVRLWHVPVFAFLLGLTNVFDIPARQSFVVEMVGKQDLPAAIGLNSSLFNAARVFGPWIAATLIHRLGAGPGELEGVGRCFLVNGVSYLPVLAGLWSIRPVAPPRSAGREPLRTQLRETAEFLRGHGGLRSLMALLAAESLFMTGDWILLPALAKYVLGTDAAGFGQLMALRGVGALCAALWLAAHGRSEGKGRVVVIAAVLWPVLSVATAAIGRFDVARFLIPLAGCAMICFLVGCNQLVQTSTPDHLRGRVMGVHAWLMMGLNPPGSLVAGAVAGRAGTAAAVVAGGMVSLVFALWFLLRRPELRRSGAQLDP
ncbi:MAG: MFS transporter [Armatimonadota bacterium]